MTQALRHNFKKFWLKRPETGICILIFFASVYIYLSNNQTITTNDNIPVSLIALNWLQNHTLHLDIFRNSHFYGSNGQCLRCWDGTPYFFIEAPNGHLTSSYPIGTSIVTFPIYAVVFLAIKVWTALQGNLDNSQSILLDITNPQFTPYRWMYEKIVASTITAFSVVLFYLLARLNYSRFVALTATFIFAFATNIWVVASQGLTQHTITVLLLIGTMLCLFKANRLSGKNQAFLLAIAGIFCGFLLSIRPTNFLFVLIFLLYALVVYKRRSLYLITGLSSLLISIAWNWYFFGFNLSNLLTAGYPRLFEYGASNFELAGATFIQGFSGQLLNPNRGLFIFSPVILFAIPGIIHYFRDRSSKDNLLIAALLIGCGILIVQYSFYVPWWGAISYGSRFLCDILPILVYPICYFIEGQLERHLEPKRVFFKAALPLFIALTIYSTSVQIIGAFSTPRIWESTPFWLKSRLWEWQDTMIARHAQNLYFQIVPPIRDPSRYLEETAGEIEQIKRRNNLPLPTPLTFRARRGGFLKAVVRNSGETEWFGYQTGMQSGVLQVRVQTVNLSGKKAAPTSFLHLSGRAKPGETAEAIGSVAAPAQPGDYTLSFELIISGVGVIPDQPQPLLTVPLKVVPRQTPNHQKLTATL